MMSGAFPADGLPAHTGKSKQGYLHIAAALAGTGADRDDALLDKVYAPLIEALRTPGIKSNEKRALFFGMAPLQALITHTMNNGRLPAIAESGMLFINRIGETPLSSAKLALSRHTPKMRFEGMRDDQPDEKMHIRMERYHSMASDEFERACLHLQKHPEITMATMGVRNLLGAHYNILAHCADGPDSTIAIEAQNKTNDVDYSLTQEFLPYIALSDADLKTGNTNDASLEKIYTGGLVKAFRGKALESTDANNVKTECPFSRSLTTLWSANIVQGKDGRYAVDPQPRAGALPAFIHRHLLPRFPLAS